MLFGVGARRDIAKFFSGAVRFCTDRRGVAAIEFAFIAPVLFIMYFVTMEVAQGIEANKKVSRIGSMVADLVTQRPTVTPSDLDAIMRIADSTLQPYNRSSPKIVITEITISADAKPKATVAWSRKMENGAFSKGDPAKTPVTIPTSLNIGGTFLVRVDSYLNYQPILTWTAEQKQATGLFASFDNLPMSETYYLRPRMSTSVDCATC
ncbi:MAG TPA: TadE/TadG family type IV pilus assembly protein [Mesorhizobium sp.]